MKINKIVNRSGLVVTCLAGVILTGCATHPGGKTNPDAWITQCNLTPKEQQCLLTVKKKYDAMTTEQQHSVITWFKDHYKRQSMWKRAGKKHCPSMTPQHLSRIYSKVSLCATTRKHDLNQLSDHSMLMPDVVRRHDGGAEGDRGNGGDTMNAKELIPVRALLIKSVASSENDGRAKAQEIKKAWRAGAWKVPAGWNAMTLTQKARVERKVTKFEMRDQHGLKWNNQQNAWVPVKTGKKAAKKE